MPPGFEPSNVASRNRHLTLMPICSNNYYAIINIVEIIINIHSAFFYSVSKCCYTINKKTLICSLNTTHFDILATNTINCYLFDFQQHIQHNDIFLRKNCHFKIFITQILSRCKKHMDTLVPRYNTVKFQRPQSLADFLMQFYVLCLQCMNANCILRADLHGDCRPLSINLLNLLYSAERIQLAKLT